MRFPLVILVIISLRTRDAGASLTRRRGAWTVQRCDGEGMGE
jgi:hypothetical protein